MTTLYSLKPRFQQMLRPMVHQLAKGRVTANQVTVAAMLLSLTVGAAFALSEAAVWSSILFLLWMPVRMAFNAVDGMLAREYGQASRTGQYLNEFGDIVSDLALFLPFANVLDPLWLVPPLLFVLAECAGILGAAVDGVRRYDGPFGKADRAATYAGLTFLMFFTNLGGAVHAIAVTLLSILTLATVFNRCRETNNA